MNTFKPSKNYYQNQFIPKLILGKFWEDQAQERIIKYLNNKFKIKNICDTNEYDFELTNNSKYEIKCDLKANETNNIFIEYLQFGKPSGIQTTKADFYIIIVPPMTFIIIDVLELTFLIETTQYVRIIQPQPYNNFTAGYIFEMNLIIKNGYLI